MGRELRGIQARLLERLFHQSMNCRNADSITVPRTKQGSIVCQKLLFTLQKIGIDGLAARGTKVDEPFLITFTDHTKSVLINIRDIQANQLTATNTAVEKDHQNSIIAYLIRPFYCLEQGRSLLHRQILR